MKNIIFALALIFCATSTNAQLRLGIKANYGKTISDVNTMQYGNEQGYLNYELSYISTKDCTAFGLTSYYEVGNLWFQSDMMYRQCTSRFAFKDYTEQGRPETMLTESYQTFHLPIQAGILHNNFKFGVGPMFNFNLQSELALDEMEEFEAKPRDLSMGFQFLVGYKMNEHIHLDLKFERTFNNIGDHYRYRNTPTSLGTSPNMLSVSLACIL